ncbi:MAG: hypothetical protein K2Z80_28075 [Xanthobacteraceae bacterium]|nr:hypothetical protein [Xanthobacteraceae bacterium]
MQKRLASIAALCALASALIAINLAPAEARSSHTSIRAQCHKEAGAYWNAGRRRWQYQGGIGTAQVQRFYDCLDQRTMKTR